MRVSFITTVYNEEKTVKRLLSSLFSQSRLPDEIIIVDGGSTDNTIKEISSFKFNNTYNKLSIKLIFKKGNRSVGRNEAIKLAKNEIIVCSDAGCILNKDWIKNIIKPFNDSKIDVVSGYYRGISETVFQKCLIPYVLIMADRANSKLFLPATRSMAFKKKIWEKVGKFPEKLSNNEDYFFAKKIKEIKANIFFEKEAIVYWLPRENIKQSYNMFYRFAKGDAESGILRPKVILIFLRYIIGVVFLLLYFSLKEVLFFRLILFLFFCYLLWSILKNYKYVKNWKAIYYLPLIQIISDSAVLIGTSVGIINKK